MLRSFGKIGPQIDQIWAWLSGGHRWSPGVQNPLKSSVTGPSLLVNCYLEIKFQNNQGEPPPPPLNYGFCGQIIAKNDLNYPYLSSRHLRNRSQHFSYFSAIFQYFLRIALEKKKNLRERSHMTSAAKILLTSYVNAPLLLKADFFNLGLQKKCGI